MHGSVALRTSDGSLQFFFTIFDLFSSLKTVHKVRVTFFSYVLLMTLLRTDKRESYKLSHIYNNQGRNVRLKSGATTNSTWGAHRTRRRSEKIWNLLCRMVHFQPYFSASPLSQPTDV